MPFNNPGFVEVPGRQQSQVWVLETHTCWHHSHSKRLKPCRFLQGQTNGEAQTQIPLFFHFQLPIKYHRCVTAVLFGNPALFLTASKSLNAPGKSPDCALASARISHSSAMRITYTGSVPLLWGYKPPNTLVPEVFNKVFLLPPISGLFKRLFIESLGT